MLCHRKRDVIGVTATLICYRSYYSIHARLEVWIAANYNDMVDIVDELHKYIPKTTSVQTFQVNTEGGGSEVVTLNIDHFYHILIGGDQLTAARIRCGQGILSNSVNGWECVRDLFLSLKTGTQNCAVT